MQIGFAAPVSGSWATPDSMVRIARRAEELGYSSLWTFQRLLSPVEGDWGETYRSVQDPVVTLGFLAAHTRRIRLGVAVLNVPFVSPTYLAKQLSTVDILCHGRLDVGLGLGWATEEFTATGASEADRGRRVVEYVDVLRTLWRDEVVEHDGDLYRIPPARMEPKPVQRPYPPILLGGGVPAALRRAGRIADGWISSSRADLSVIGDSVATVRQAAEKAGRDPAALRFICRGVVRVRPAGSPERKPLTGTLDEIHTDIHDLARQGITEMFIDLNFDPEIGSPDADPAASVARAEDVLEAFAPEQP